MQRAITSIGVIVCIVSTTLCAQPRTSVSLDEYLTQVEATNPEIKSINLELAALDKKVRELDMAYSTYVTSGLSWIKDDGGPGFISPFVVTDTRVLNVGANKKYRSGATVSAGITDTYISMLPNIFFSETQGYEVKSFVRVDQSLLRDYKSRYTQAGIQKSFAAARAAQMQKIFQKQHILRTARVAYWTLSLTRALITFRTASRARAEKILAWNEKRIQVDLVEESDVLQARAGYTLAQLSLKLAEEDERIACRAYNKCLGIVSDTVDGAVDSLMSHLTDCETKPFLTPTGERADVRAAREQCKSFSFAEEETTYRLAPELTLTGSYSLRGLATGYSDAWSQIAGLQKPTYTVGFSFVMPIDGLNIFTVKQGYQADRQSGDEALHNAEIAAKTDWDQLVTTWDNVKARLEIARQILAVQQQRVLDEQRRFERGRTTTYMFLQAHNDVDEATVTVYRLIFEALGVLAEAELYNN